MSMKRAYICNLCGESFTMPDHIRKFYIDDEGNRGIFAADWNDNEEDAHLCFKCIQVIKATDAF